ncbi:MAG TPA: YHYH protein, partial [Verrucomicrobiae bacterium]|nr:YHYH protein [Verrucomicrobiae bacterium]
VPVSPVMAKTPIPAGHALFGIAVNGVPFDPATAEFWNNDMRSGWNYEANTGFLDLGLDQNNAHVQPSGAYHYHGLPTGLIARLARKHKVSTESASMLLIGWAADGFPIYNNYGHSSPLDASSPLKKLHSSYRVKHGDRPGGAEGPGGKYDGRFTADFEYVKGSGDLDECNGTYGVTPEFPRGTYYYAVTEEFPFISRFWRGEPDSSFFKRKPGPAGGRRGMRPRPGIRPSEGRAGEPGFGPQGPNQ